MTNTGSHLGKKQCWRGTIFGGAWYIHKFIYPWRIYTLQFFSALFLHITACWLAELLDPHADWLNQSTCARFTMTYSLYRMQARSCCQEIITRVIELLNESDSCLELRNSRSIFMGRSLCCTQTTGHCHSTMQYRQWWNHENYRFRVEAIIKNSANVVADYRVGSRFIPGVHYMHWAGTWKI
jgi:hypothetical protein